ncbi:HTH-type transcriptional repressor AseR [compost metagenome]
MKPQDLLKGCCSAPSPQASFPIGLEEKARLFKALGDEVRLKLLHLVRDQEVCVCDLVTAMGMAQGTLSHHLSVLHQAGLVTARKQGRWNYYQATALALDPLEVFGTEKPKAKT